MTVLNVRLPAGLKARLEALAKATGRSKSVLVREALLECLEDWEDLALAKSRLADIRAGRSSTCTLDELMQADASDAALQRLMDEALADVDGWGK
ncbi:MAG: DUF6290 family protein [Gammaproteobacteria bacterium]|nr:DUF6290 family protein [Gammaproteobacteria bacterium]